MILLTSILVFILGASIGSFLSVIVHRLKDKKHSIIFGHSICPSCKQKIKWRHLIPVLSWFILRGKCAYCGKKISPHYVILELLTGIVFMAMFWHCNFIISIPSITDPSFLSYDIDWKIFEKFLFHIVEFSFLLAIFFYDLLYREIPDRLSVPAIAIAILGGFIFADPTPLSMLIGGGGIFIFFLLQFYISGGKWIGGGDLRLGALIGILLGIVNGVIAIVIAYILGALFSIILLITKKATGKSAIPFAPFLVMGAFIGFFFGQQIFNWYMTFLTF